MDLICIPPGETVRRLKSLRMEANTFEEERILLALFDVINRGGSIDIRIKEQGAFPARSQISDFGGVSE